ncbi:50S ribosomal protein L11 methyltransferase [Pseudohongiella spirulinae]|uniref:Ribosomal protein L11 methyltransferase n=1 Tax=Pseudohongiella spirulinae TaxID=1249552 RepID=A0A0S2KA07_9GAMM|nr:50S ribosomal protein L11 methyltransferase [Pseudohongiella spirulinae]ALO45196.1 Ribosomal protein L11 methyltransferase [Pseudohongiella spirulinae]
MPWQQIKARITDTEAPQMEQLFQSLGAVSVSFLDAEDEPVFQLDPDSTPLWQQTLLSVLFEADADLEDILTTVKSASRLEDRDLIVEQIDDQDWERAWMDEFKPIRFGRRLWVCPTWCQPQDPGAVNILLDPGLAFGSGTHPTTAMCLEWLDGLDLTDKTVIDYGCGSGILAIAAVLLGARQVIAIDNDPQALIATANNRDANGIAAGQLTVHLPGEQHAPADIMVANILSGPLVELTPILTGLTRTGGQLALSGVLSEQTNGLIEAYRQGFDLQEPIVRDEWVCVTGVRRAPGG